MPITFEEISRMSLFRGFSKNFVRLLDMFFVEKKYPLDTEITRQNSMQKTFYIILAGEVQISEQVNKKEVILSQLSAGQFFGEMNLFDPGLATATVTTLTPVRTLEISTEQFRKFISQKPELAADFVFQLAEIIVKRFRHSKDTIQKELTSPKALDLGRKLDSKKRTA